MKKILAILIIYLTVLPSIAETIHTYDKYGNALRTYRTSPNGESIHVSDKYGNYVGTIRKTGDRDFHIRDSQGTSMEGFSSDGMYGTMYDDHGSVTGTFRSY